MQVQVKVESFFDNAAYIYRGTTCLTRFLSSPLGFPVVFIHVLVLQFANICVSVTVCDSVSSCVSAFPLQMVGPSVTLCLCFRYSSVSLSVTV